MIEDLRKNLKEDVWKLINNEQIEAKNESFFIIAVLSILLEKDTFSLEQVMCLVEKLKNIYNNALDKTNKLIIEDYGEIIGIIKEVFSGFDKDAGCIINKIKGE